MPYLNPVPLPERQQKSPLMFTGEQTDRIERARKARGQTWQTFGALAVMKEVEAAEDEVATLKERRTRRKDKEVRRDAEPMGLGFQFKGGPPLEETPEPAPAPPSPVTINVGTQGGDDIIARLTQYVLTAPPHERDTRLRSAVENLRAYCRTDAERQDLAAKLDIALAAHQKPGELAKFKSAIGAGFDKFKDLLS